MSKEQEQIVKLCKYWDIDTISIEAINKYKQKYENFPFLKLTKDKVIKISKKFTTKQKMIQNDTSGHFLSYWKILQDVYNLEFTDFNNKESNQFLFFFGLS